MPQFKRGDIVKCFKCPDHLKQHITLRKTYVVCRTFMQFGGQYITVLSNLNQGRAFPHDVFRLYKRNPKP